MQVDRMPLIVALRRGFSLACITVALTTGEATMAAKDGQGVIGGMLGGTGVEGTRLLALW